LDLIEAGGLTAGLAAGLRDAQRGLGQHRRFGGIDVVAGSEAPAAPVQYAHADSGIRGVGVVVNTAVSHGDAFAAAVNHADVRVIDAPALGLVEECVDDFLHSSASTSEEY